MKSFISLTDQIKPIGFDSTCGSIDLIFSARAYCEPNFMMILNKIRLDQPCRQENDILIFHYNLKNQKNFKIVERENNYTAFKSFLRDKLHEIDQKLKLENVQSRTNNFIFSNVTVLLFL